MVVDPRDVKIAALEEEVACLKKSRSAIENEFIELGRRVTKLENQVNSLESWAYRPMYSDNPINRRGRY